MDTIGDQNKRQAAIQVMIDVMTKAGVAPEEAAKFAPVLVDKELSGEKTL